MLRRQRHSNIYKQKVKNNQNCQSYRSANKSNSHNTYSKFILNDTNQILAQKNLNSINTRAFESSLKKHANYRIQQSCSQFRHNQVQRLQKINKNFQVQYIQLSKSFKSERIINLNLKQQIDKLRQTIFQMRNIQIEYGQLKCIHRKLQQKIYNYQQKLNKSQQQKKAYERVIIRQQLQRKQVINSVKEVQMINTEFNIELQGIRQINLFLSRSVQQKDLEILNLQDLHTEVKKEIQILSNKVTSQIDSLEYQSKTQICQLQQKHRQGIKNMQVTYTQELQIMRKQLQIRQMQIIQKSQKMSQLNLQMESFCTQYKSLQSKHEQLSKTQQTIKVQYRKLQEQIKRLNEEVEQTKQNSNLIRKNSIQLKMQCDFIVTEIKNKLEAIQQQNESQKSQLLKLNIIKMQHQNAKKEQHSRSIQVKQYQLKIQQLNSIIFQLNYQIKQLQDNLKSATEDAFNSKSEVQKLNNKLKEYQLKIQVQETTQCNLHNQMQTLREINQTHLIQAQKFHTQIKQLTQNQTQINCQLSQLAQQNKIHKQKLCQNQQKLFQATQILTQFYEQRNTIAKMKQKIQDLTHEREQMTIQITLLQNQNISLQERVKLKSPIKLKPETNN